MKTVFSCGMGVQSTTILGLACDGVIPKPDHIVFSDPGAESEATYRHAQWCMELADKHGMKVVMVSAGNIYEDALTFARRRENAGIKRYASIPLFVKKEGQKEASALPRQCTSEYKLEPIEQYHRRVVLGLKPRQRAPKEIVVDVWIGISANEERRATPPGVWRTHKVKVGDDLLGEPVFKDVKKWEPVIWQQKSFPLLGYSLTPERTRKLRPEFSEITGWDRDDCINWLKKRFPGIKVPRSACVFCPYRTNAEWLEMKTHEPAEFAKA